MKLFSLEKETFLTKKFTNHELKSRDIVYY